MQRVGNDLVDVPIGTRPRDDGFWVSRSMPAVDTVAQGVEIRGIGNFRRRGVGALKQHAPQVLSILILADEFADVLAAGCVPAADDLFVHKGSEWGRQGNVHAAHG